MTPADLEELLGPLRDPWRCRRCLTLHAVPSLARDCETRDLSDATGQEGDSRDRGAA